MTRMNERLKRGFDVVASTLGLVGLSPVLLLMTGALKVYNRGRGGVFFAQERVGRNGQPFRMYKFRSMDDSRDASGELLDDSKRVTSLGMFLRRSGLDELPQLWNILRGDMSLVGPRPLLRKDLDKHYRGDGSRHSVRPGLTGWAQVNGRCAISWEEKFNLDNWYLANSSALLDARILLLTVKALLSPPEFFNKDIARNQSNNSQ